MKKKGLIPLYQVMLLLFTLFLASCGGQTGQTAKNDGAEPVSDPKLDVAYQRILVLPVDIGAKFAKDYPEAAADCRAGLIVGLETSKRFHVKLVDEIPAQTERGTLVVKLAVTDMRIVSGPARPIACSVIIPFLGSAIVGSSNVNVKMTLIDANTGQVIREKEFFAHNNPITACYRGGTDHSTDKTIQKDMGLIVGDYITAVVP